MLIGSLNYGVFAIRNFNAPAAMFQDVFEFTKNRDLQQAFYMVFFVSFLLYVFATIYERCPVKLEFQPE